MVRPLLIVFAVSAAIALAAGIGAAVVYKAGPAKPPTDPGPVETRDFPWKGSPSLQIDVPAEVIYLQGSSAKFTATANAATLDALEVTADGVKLKDGCNVSWKFWVGGDKSSRRHFQSSCDSLTHGASPLKITITGPSTDRFELSGAGSLDLQAYDQPTLTIDISGAGKTTATGKTGKLDVDLSGATNADLSNLTVTDAKLDISGIGHAKLKPTGNADISISGAGIVDLLAKPAHLNQDISGAGRINQP